MRNERRNSILMTRHYPDLGSASDWSSLSWNLVQPIRSTTQILREMSADFSREKLLFSYLKIFFWAKRVYNLVSRTLCATREPRVVLASCKIGCPIFLSFFLSLNISLGFRQWRHVALPLWSIFVSRQHINFAADDQAALWCFIHEGPMCFFIGESRTIFHANDTEH